MAANALEILHVLQDGSGGGPAQALALAAHAARSGSRVAVAAPGGPAWPPPMPPAGVRVFTLPPGRALPVRLARLAGRAEVLHVHGARPATWALPALALRPSVVTFHGLHPLRRQSGPAYAAAARALVSVITLAADRVICVSEAEAADLARIGFGPPKVQVILNALPAGEPVDARERAGARAALGLPQDELVLLYLGRLEPAKDPLTAVAVGNALPRGRLLMAGDGALRGPVEAAAGPRVELLGHRSDTRRLLAAADILLSTSLWEGTPLAVLEAMWAGVPVLASRVAGHTELLGDAAELAGPGDVGGFLAGARALEDPRRRAALARDARERVLQRPDEAAMFSRTQALLAATARGGRARSPARS